jgi:hypothetical protein
MLSQTCPNKRGVKVLKTVPRLSEINEMRAAVSGPEKAGVGGSTPSLATTFQSTCSESLHLR